MPDNKLSVTFSVAKLHLKKENYIPDHNYFLRKVTNYKKIITIGKK